MRLYLVRHGQYLTSDKDPEGSLSEEGRQQSRRLARFFNKKKVKVDIIWHNNKKRSAQTAQILAQGLEGVGLAERDDLGPADSVNKFPQEINNLNKDLMIVGHNPFLKKLAILLLGGITNPESLDLVNCGAICLEYKEAWMVGWSINPDLCD